jgi:hypothetical protein
MELFFHCACCGEGNNTFIDPDDGDFQELVQDCPVCSGKNSIHAHFNYQTTSYDLEIYPETAR